MAEVLSWFSYRLKLMGDKKEYAVNAVKGIEEKALKAGYGIITDKGLCDYASWADEMRKLIYYEYTKYGVFEDKYFPHLLVYVWVQYYKTGDDSRTLRAWAEKESYRRENRKRSWVFGSIIGVLSIVVIVESIILLTNTSRKMVEDPQNQVQGLMSNGSSDVDVYMCTGENATSYHLYRDCMGLSNCSGYLIVMGRDEAEERGRHLCGFCKNR